MGSFLSSLVVVTDSIIRLDFFFVSLLLLYNNQWITFGGTPYMLGCMLASKVLLSCILTDGNSRYAKSMVIDDRAKNFIILLLGVYDRVCNPCNDLFTSRTDDCAISSFFFSCYY